MKHQFRGVCLLLCLFIIIAPGSKAKAEMDYGKDLTYVYSRDGLAVRIPDAYEYKKGISLKEAGEKAGITINGVSDLFVREDGMLYVVTAEPGGILCISKNGEFQYFLGSFSDFNGDEITLKNPQGVFVSEDDTFYIADTDHNRIVICTRDGNVSNIVEKPDNLLGTDLTSFLPKSVVVDTAGRISVVATNINSGIMQFTSDGTFTGYTGAPSVKIDAFTKLLRKISTKEQRAQMQNFVPTEYNNIKIDSKNFIWGTISSISLSDLQGVVSSKDLTGSVTPIKKLNTMGTDVLRRKGVYAPIGDLSFIDTPSKIIDVGLGPNNIYSLLDSQKGRIFTYNNDGILLYAFGNKGTKKGNVQTPIALDYVGEDMYVLDAGLGQILIYTPTHYGKLLIDAEGYYADGDYQMANSLFKQVAELNSNFEYAYIGLGNAQYSSGNYDEAMEYYEYADDSESYSKAKEKLRKATSEKAFPVIFGVFLAAVAGGIIISVGKRIHHYAKGEQNIVRKGEEE